MKQMVTLGAFVLSIIATPSIIFAKEKPPQVTCKNDKGVEVTISKLGYDAQGEIYQGTITKNGRVIRNSKMRRSVSNYFSLYALGRDGTTTWSFKVDSPRTASVTDWSEYFRAIAKDIGAIHVELKCNSRTLPAIFCRDYLK